MTMEWCSFMPETKRMTEFSVFSVGMVR